MQNRFGPKQANSLRKLGRVKTAFNQPPLQAACHLIFGLLYRNRRSTHRKTVRAVSADDVDAAVAGGAVFDTEGGGGGVRLEKRTGVYKSYKKLVAGVPLAESEYVRQLVEREGLGESSDENFIEVCIYMEKAQHNIRKEPYAIYEKNPSQYDLEVNT